MLKPTREILASAMTYVVRAEMTVTATRYRVARSRRRLHPGFVVSGGSFDHDTLVSGLRDRLTSGELPLIASGECWAGPATGGRSCTVCGVVIGEGAAEYEVPHGGDQSLRAHATCFFTCRLESQRLHGSRTQALSPARAVRQGDRLAFRGRKVYVSEQDGVRGTMDRARAETPDMVLRSVEAYVRSRHLVL